MTEPNVHGPETNDQEFFDRLNRERFARATVCERCKSKPPTDILRYTSYCAVCADCRDYLLGDLAARRASARSFEE